jgi:hypothetical protein
MAESYNEDGVIETEPRFVKLYVEQLCAIKGLSPTQYKMTLFFLSKMDSNNEVLYRTRHRDIFCHEHGITAGTFNNNIKPLIDSGIIKRIGNSEFLFNPRYASKTNWANVQKIRWVIEFDEDTGATDKVFFDDKELPY